MRFVSFDFVVFAAAVLLLYYAVPGKCQWIVLLLGSLIFYALADPRYLIFLLVTVCSTYFAARSMTGKPKKQRRPALIWCLALNFGALFFCKGLLLFPRQNGPLSFLTLALPLGLSFYIFQAAGYLLDVYRGTGEAEKSIGRFALFLCYFPQLVQGPISRHSQIAHQLYAPHPFSSKALSFGAQRMLWGYFKKLVIADRIAPAVMALRSQDLGGTGFLLLTLFYAVQIYADFTGGIDITLGLSEALGITLPENFNHPYGSRSIAEYWRRWHITLGTWMKDYIFFPVSICAPMRKLGKAARKRFPKFGKRLPVYIATIVTWFFTGIWHGLTPNFIVWGMLNCLVIIASEEFAPAYEKFHSRFHWNEKSWWGGFQAVRTFCLMNLIRACDLFPNVSGYFKGLGSIFTGLSPIGLENLKLSWLDAGILAFPCFWLGLSAG